MSLIDRIPLLPLWRSKVKQAKAPVEANGGKPPAAVPFKAGASQPPSVSPVAKGAAKEAPKQPDSVPKLKPWVKPGSQGQAAPGAAAPTAATPVAASKEAGPVAASAPPGATQPPSAPASAPAAAPAATGSGLKDDLASLFTDDEVGNEELHKLAEGLKELDVNALSRECRELVALLKGKVAQNYTKARMKHADPPLAVM
ncbi:MAG: hypothetical protein Q8O40_16240 [Chloroflexota bacterium]|nr:hypothetical protein [Chloroflexota bacterium]